MKYSKSVVFSLTVLILFSASCLIATYQIHKDIEKIDTNHIALLDK